MSFIMHSKFRFLAVGPAYSAVAALFAIGDSTGCEICTEVALAIAVCMQEDYLPVPNHGTWMGSAAGFNQLRSFPKTLGAVDGKHIAITKPNNTGSAFFNYKVTCELVLI